MLNTLHEQTSVDQMNVNPSKCTIVHFRPRNIHATNACLEIVDKYVHLGLPLDQLLLDFKI